MGHVYVPKGQWIGNVRLGMLKFYLSTFSAVLCLSQAHTAVWTDTSEEQKSTLTSLPEKTVPPADRHPRLSVLKAYCVTEKQHDVLDLDTIEYFLDRSWL